ncbi:MAG: amino acid adenylation domain-containing protein [Gemmatimonadota bacterium]
MIPPQAPAAGRPLSREATELLARRALGRKASALARRADRSRARLTPAQQRIWLHDQLEGGVGYIRPVALRIRGPLDVAALECALDAIVARHEALHARVEIGADGIPLLRIVAPEPVSLDVRDVDDISSAGYVDSRILDEAHRAFDLRIEPPMRVRLFRAGAATHVLLAVFHHIAFDGWSVSVYLRELAAAYAAARDGMDIALGEVAFQCGDLAEIAPDGAQVEADLAYWRAAVQGVDPMLALPLDHPRHAHEVGDAARVEFVLEGELVSTLRKLSRDEGVTTFMVLAAGFQTLLARHTGQEDFLIGTPIAGRTRPEMENLIGCFINTLALRCDLTGAPTFREVLQRVRRTATGAFAHQALPFEEVVKLLDRPPDRHVPTGVQVLFNFRNLPAATPRLAGAEVERIDIPARVTMFDLELDVTDTGTDIRGTLIYPASLIGAMSARRLAVHLRRLLESAAADPACAVGELEMMSDGERHELLNELSGTTAPVPERACIHHLIAEQAAAHPDAVAVTGPAGDMTFAALMDRAETIAAALRVSGVQRGDRVGLSVERSPDLIAAMLGAMIAGAAYVPLDPDYPDERIAFMIADSSLRCIVSDAGSSARLGAVTRTPLVRTDELTSWAQASPAAPGPALQDDAAYVIYTSGSTGTPKGAVIGHRALVAFATAVIRELDISSCDRFLQFSTPNFDASIMEIFPTLAAGGAVVLRDAAMAESADGFLAGCTDWSVTMAVPPTAFWHEVIGTLAADGKQFAPSLRLMAPGGERMLPERAALWQSVAPGATLLNAYGPTETTVHVTRYRVPDGYAASGGVPIGRPIANTRLYVLDRSRRLLPRGAPGELYIGGPQLADGYLGRPDLTAERFIPNPFAPGERLYRTGDLVRWRNDGDLAFFGRLDRQVKVRGFRVEIGEVESALLEADGVQECMVEARESNAGEQRLVGYVVLNDASDVSETVAAVAAQLRRKLPGYMLPALIPVPRIPRTPNGKLDRAALPALQLRTDGTGDAPIAPRTQLESQLIAIWERLLEVHPIGIGDDFFLMGGHSLLAMRMVHEVQRTCGCELPLSVLFEHATIEGIAAEIERAAARAPTGVRTVLNAGGRRPPLIFLHGDVLGAGLYCRDIARRLGPDQPVYPVGPPGPGGPATIEAMAAAEVVWIRAELGGACRLAGFCNGAVVAFEVARQLERAGGRVEFVFMIDAPARNVGLEWLDSLLRVLFTPPDADASLSRRAAVLRRVADTVQRVRMFWSKHWTDKLRAGVRRSWYVLRTGRSIAPDEWAAERSQAPPPRELGFVGRAVNAYVPGSYGGDLHVVVSTSMDGGVRELRRWEQRARNVKAYDAGVSHEAVITDVVPDLLQRCLRTLDQPDSPAHRGAT